MGEDAAANVFAERFDVGGGGTADIDQEVAMQLGHLRAAHAQPAAARRVDQLPGFMTLWILERGAAGRRAQRLRFGARGLNLVHAGLNRGGGTGLAPQRRSSEDPVGWHGGMAIGEANLGAAQLNKIEGYKAVLIRDGDYYVGLRQRIEQGHDANADLYLAIHADAADNKNATGATVYALSDRGATSEQARRLADKENNADLIGGVGSVSLTDKDAMLASVLLDLSMTASVATSLDIGNELINSLGAVTRLRRRNVEQAAFVELKSADIPSLLIESGYITNSDDARQLDSSAWRKQFAGALTNGITRWFHKRPPRGTLIAWNQQHGATTAAGPSTYTVRRGDSLSMVAQRFKVTMAELKDANNIKRDSIQVGQIPKIPAVAAAKAAFKEHTIAHGETLSQIAISYAIPLDVIRATNELKSDTIRPGQVLKIPAS